MRAEAKKTLKNLRLVSIPKALPGITKTEREKIEKLARQKVRNHYRPRAEYYEIPSYIRRKENLKKYYQQRLQMEIELREGYVCCC